MLLFVVWERQIVCWNLRHDAGQGEVGRVGANAQMARSTAMTQVT